MPEPTRIRGVSQRTNDAARQNRKRQTDAECVLWDALRNRQLAGLKFRRQQPLGPFVVDFCCADRRLIVEIDGETHEDQRDYDQARTEHLSAYEYQVLRFTNDEVCQDLDNVLRRIEQAANSQ